MWPGFFMAADAQMANHHPHLDGLLLA